MLSEIVILALLALNIFQFIFWSRDHHRLVDKLMSRNYAEYAQSKSLVGTGSQQPQSTNDDSAVIEENQILKELNSQMGVKI